MKFFWNNRREQVREVLRSYHFCQLMKKGGKLRSRDVELHSILVTEFMHMIALDTAGPLPCTQRGNKYILVAIDHFSKWLEAREVPDHEACTIVLFLKNDILGCGFVSKIVLIDNSVEWHGRFAQLCEQNGIGTIIQGFISRKEMDWWNASSKP